MLLGLVSVALLTLQSGLTQKEGESCILPHNNIPGVCTPASKCQSAKQDYVDKAISPTFCNHSIESLLVCCKDETSNLNTGNNMNSNPLLDGNNTLRLSERKCEEYGKAMVQTVYDIPLLPELGGSVTISDPGCDYSGVELIVGGENANQGEFPYMAAVGWIDDEDNKAFYCGGSLISSRFVLTAGHCTRHLRLKNPTPSFVRLGDHNLDPHAEDGANPVDIPIKTVHKHPDYKAPSKYNDIALLELNEDVSFNRDIKPACLWTKSDFSSSRALTTFWEAHGSKEPSTEILQKLSLSLLENDDCEKLLEETRNIRWYGLLPSQVCATAFHRRKDSCWGQSGSPLQITSRDNKCIHHIVGVTSLGHRCPQSGRPALYTRVSSYLDWIESIVWPGEII